MGRTYQFCHVSDVKNCGVILYDKKNGTEIRRVSFPEERRVGRVYRMELPAEDCLYQFFEGEKRCPDPKGRAFYAAKKYGEEKGPEDLYAVMYARGESDFDWQGTRNPRLAYSDCLVYCLHVRGFTKHASSGVKARGTFRGVTEKIPYLKSIGVTTLEFQPIYEFVEKPRPARGGIGGMAEAPRLNYWGYTQGFYYAPKADYAWKDAVFECKEMIRELHANGMEAVLQFYFPKEFNPMQIPEVLRFWVEEYRVDGFHLIGENLPAELIARDPELSDVKIWYYRMDAEAVYGRRAEVWDKTLGLLRDDFMYEGRRFLKGDENLIASMTHHLRTVPAAVGCIHYLSTYWGFTLMDMVSYDFKHNEANGEDNHDGTDYNCSWNCGEEGFSRKKRIQQMRLRQLKNALCLLFFAQSTPRIFMGDEFGNSQKGNNNPYCQDNEVTWLNWKNLERHQELFQFFRRLLDIRRANPVLHPRQEAKMMDSISCGYPDLSFHGETAWRPQLENYVRHLGVMYCGLYGREEQERQEGPKEAVALDGKGDRVFDFMYLAMNMHWEGHKLGLPRLPKGKKWVPCFTTGDEGRQPEQDVVWIPAKTMAFFVSADIAPPEDAKEGVPEGEQSKGRTKPDGMTREKTERKDSGI